MLRSGDLGPVLRRSTTMVTAQIFQLLISERARLRTPKEHVADLAGVGNALHFQFFAESAERSEGPQLWLRRFAAPRNFVEQDSRKSSARMVTLCR